MENCRSLKTPIDVIEACSLSQGQGKTPKFDLYRKGKLNDEGNFI